MKRFLNNNKNIINKLNKEKFIINLVIGNQSCDADSMISSLCYAYYKQLTSSNSISSSSPLSTTTTTKLTTSTSNNLERQYIPIMTIKRNDIIFKREVNLLLNLINVTFDDLICIDELSFNELYDQNLLEITLMDHNQLSPNLDQLYSTIITEIIDHHIDQGSYPYVQGNSRIIAFNEVTRRAEVGSTCTLVAEKFQNSNLINQEIALLLLGVIKLDTINMSLQASIGTERDQLMINYLQEFQEDSTKSFDLYSLLENAKYDQQFWSELQLNHSLRLDYKLFGSIGMSSIMIPTSLFIQKEDFVKGCKEYINKENIDGLVILSLVSNPEIKRELTVISESNEFVEKLVHYLQNVNNQFLELTRMNEDDIIEKQRLFSLESLYIQSFFQRNTRASRKQVAPEVVKFQQLLASDNP